MYARLAATLKSLSGSDAARHAVAPQNPYARSKDFLVDLRTIEASLRANHGAALIAQRLHPLIRTVDVFLLVAGFEVQDCWPAHGQGQLHGFTLDAASDEKFCAETVALS